MNSLYTYLFRQTIETIYVQLTGLMYPQFVVINFPDRCQRLTFAHPRDSPSRTNRYTVGSLPMNKFHRCRNYFT